MGRTGLVWCILCGILICGDAFHSRKWSNAHGTSLVQHNGEVVQKSFGFGQSQNEVLGQSPSPSRLPTENGYNVRHRSRKLVLGIVLGSLTGIAAAGFVVGIIRTAVTYINRTPLVKGPMVFDPWIGSKLLPFVGQEGCLDEADLMGVGPSGRVYRANLGNGMTVAVKRINVVENHEKQDRNARRQIQEELEVIGRIRHRNLIALNAYVRHSNAHLLVCDFIPNGSLDVALKKIGDNQLQLNWPMRHKIAVGIVMGLEHLHFHCNPPLTHSNLKPANVLLDYEFEPRLADFGLSKLMPNSGAAGYVAPECYQACRYTDKSDVFSFGVILAALLTAKDPTDSFFNEVQGGNIGCWLRCLQQSGKAIEALDKGIIEGAEDDQLEEMLMAIRIASACVADVPADRPSSAELVPMLAQLHSF